MENFSEIGFGYSYVDVRSYCHICQRHYSRFMTDGEVIYCIECKNLCLETDESTSFEAQPVSADNQILNNYGEVRKD